MSQSRHFCRTYLLIPALMAALSAVVSVFYVRLEADPYSYQALRFAWPHASAQTRAEIRDAMDNGEISIWEANALVRMALDDVGAIRTEPGDTNSEQEREKLREVMAK